MSRIFWDTNLFIYLIEPSANLHAQVADLRRAMIDRGDQLITSAMSLGEVLVKPIERKDGALAAKYEQAIASTSLVVPFDVHAARIYASLRSDRSLRPPDAIQLACAAAARVDLFITNDERLTTKRVIGVQFIVSLDRAPL